MVKIIITSAFVFLFQFVGFSQTDNKDEHKDLVEWMTLTEALEKQKTQPKKIFVDVYTDWCGWCKVMSKNTFSNEQIASYINQYFYPVRFDAETMDTIEFRGELFMNKGTGRKPTHELAYYLTNNRPSYPTIAYLDEKGKLIQAIPGYMDVVKIEPFLVYYNENVFRSAPFETFNADFKKVFNDSLILGSGKIQWLSFEDAEKLSKVYPKPILIDVFADFSYSSKIMEATTFFDKEMADYINENFYAVRFNPVRKDTIAFGGKLYINQGIAHPFHDLALHLTQRNIGIPATIYLNDKLELLSNVPGYRSPKELEPILEYFGKGIYKTQKWETYYKALVEKTEGQPHLKTKSTKQ